MKVVLLFLPIIIWASISDALGQHATRTPQVPYLTAASLDTGSLITQRKSDVRSIGNGAYWTTSETTTGIFAVRIQLRTLGKPVIEPYEVQCLFVAKDKDKSRFIYDVVKFHSSAQFDEVNVFARDLFSGTKTVDFSVSNDPVSGTTSYGDPYHGTVTRAIALTTIKPGSQLEGWIVRVLSGDRVVRSEASLSELRTFVGKESALLDTAANSVPFKE